ncbi:hypothetical protein [Paenibacillus silvisoli]|nr:hypothetical protein [Paenibacillus silvisoli]
MAGQTRNEPNNGNGNHRVAKQEKRLILLCIAVAAIMLLSLSRYVFK